VKQITESPDLVVFGATSFVGKILCRYLLEEFGTRGELKWAAAGRSNAKLEALRSSLGAQAAALPLVIADAADEASLRELCASTRVVVSTVGPYASSARSNCSGRCKRRLRCTQRLQPGGLL